jgi:hypothetical protein
MAGPKTNTSTRSPRAAEVRAQEPASRRAVASARERKMATRDGTRLS